MRIHVAPSLILTASLLFVACGPDERAPGTGDTGTKPGDAIFAYAPAVITSEQYNDGKWEKTGRTVFVYNEARQLIEERFEKPVTGGWEAMWRTTTTIVDGRPTQRIESQADGASWTTSGRHDYEFDDNHRLKSLTMSSFQAGKWNTYRRVDYQYDSDGALKQYTRHSLPDGAPTGQGVLTRADGRLSQTEWIRFDEQRQALPATSRITFGFENENLSLVQAFSLEDRTWVEDQRVAFEYAQDGRLEIMKEFNIASGNAKESSRSIYTRTDKGLLSEVVRKMKEPDQNNKDTREIYEMTTEGSSEIFELDPPDSRNEMFGVNTRMFEAYGHILIR